jgi:diguanylate cyclase (GGDEF)-like protein
MCFRLGLKILTSLADITFRLTKLNPRKSIRIAVVAPSSPGDFFTLLWKGIWSAACELASFGVRIDSFETDGHDLTAQQRILANFQVNPPAAVAFVPAHASELDRQISEISALGVPVITFHTDAPSSKRVCYVGTDAAHSGAMAGELLALLMRGRGTVASFPGPLETEHLKHRYLGFRKALKLRGPEIRESVSHSGYNGLAEAAKDALSANPPVDGIYVGCSRTHVVARALRESCSDSGRQIPIVGFDLTELSRPFLADGTLSALIHEDVYHQGYLAVQHAYEALVAAPADKCLHASLQASVMFGVNCFDSEIVERGLDPLEKLIRVRTQRVCRYQEQLDRASSQLIIMSETDSLTGLLNRSRFEELLSARAKDHEKLSILTIGLDGFEQTNHHVGQPVGDEALKAVANILRSLARPQDACARIGSDEFCILMPGSDFSQVADARDRILLALSKTVIAPQTLNLGIRVSAGAACLPGDASNAEDLIVRADNALYAHKRSASSALTSTRVPASRGFGNDFDARPARIPA